LNNEDEKFVEELKQAYVDNAKQDEEMAEALSGVSYEVDQMMLENK
jgi:hypothetical protein